MKSLFCKIRIILSLWGDSHARLWNAWKKGLTFKTFRNDNQTSTIKQLRFKLNGLTPKPKFGLATLSLISIVLAGLVLSSKTEAAWWNQLWLYRKPLTINYTGTAALTNHQIKVTGAVLAETTLYTAGKLQKDCSDLRFTDSSGQQLYYWIEDSVDASDLLDCSATNYDVWVKVSSLNTGNNTIYFYYGNPQAQSESNGNNTFEFFDDFNASSLDTTKWTSTGTVTISAGKVTIGNSSKLRGKNSFGYKNLDFRMQTLVGDGTNRLEAAGFRDSGDTNSAIFYIDSAITLTQMNTGTKAASVWSANATSTVTDRTAMQLYRIERYSAVGVKFYQNGTQLVDDTTNIPTANLEIEYNNLNTFTTTLDWVSVRSVASTEPSAPTIGSETGQSGAPVAFWPLIKSTFDSKTLSLGDVINSADTGLPPMVWLTMDDNDIDSHSCPVGGSTAGVCDVSGNGNHAAANGSMTDSDYVTGKIGPKALDFDGSNDYLTEGKSIAGGWSQLSYGAWIKTGAATYQAIVNEWSGSANFAMQMNNGQINLHIRGSWDNGVLPYTINDNTWHHLFVTYDGTKEQLFLDGRVVFSKAYTGSIINSQSCYLKVGAYADASQVPGGLFTGQIDEVKVFNYARTPDQVKADYNNTRAYFGAGSSAPMWSDNGAIQGDLQGLPLLNLDGVDDYLSIDDNNKIDFDYNQDFSVSSWAKIPVTQLDTATTSNLLLEKWSGSGGYSYVFRVYNQTNGNAGKVYFSRYDGTNNPSIMSTNTYNDNRWHYFTLIKSSSTISLYVDGKLDLTTTDTTTTTTTNTSPLYIGKRGGATGYYFQGSIAGVKIFNYALSASQVKTQYSVGLDGQGAGVTASVGSVAGASSLAPTNGLVGYWKLDGDGLDSSGNNNNGTLVNGSTYTSGKNSQALSVDGTDDYVTVPHNSAYNVTDFTVSLWTYYNGAGTGGKQYWTLLNKEASGNGNNDPFHMLVYSANYAPGIRVGNGSTAINLSSASTPLNDSKWHLVTATRQGTTIKLFVDGIQKDTQQLSGSTTNSAVMAFGVWPNYVNYYNGLLDEIRIYNRALNDDEITQLYQSGTGPIAQYQLDENAGTITKDSVANNHLNISQPILSGTKPTWQPGANGAAISLNGVDNAFQTSENTGGLVGWWKMDESANDTCSGGQDACDSSGSGYHGTATGTTIATGKIGNARSLNGSGEYVAATHNQGNNIKTVTAWFKLNALPTGTPGGIVLANASATSGPTGWDKLLRVTTGGKIEYYFHDGAGRNATGTTTLTTGVWYFVTGVTGSSSTSVYLNGNLEGSYASVSTYSGNNLIINFDDTEYSLTQDINGSIDDVRAYNRALSTNEIKDLYNNSKLSTTSSVSLSASVKPSTVGTTAIGGVVTSKGDNYNLSVIASPDTVGTWQSRSSFSTNAITTQLSGTSINDIYFYDTTKDSVDSSWRFDSTKSWYSETIDATFRNCDPATHDRCGSKEFPEKAYIVATNNNVYIFDAAENAMWMRFDEYGAPPALANAYILGSTTSNTSSIYMMNGLLYIGKTSSDNAWNLLYETKFISDSALYYHVTAGNSGNYNSTIVNRNAGSGYTVSGSIPVIVARSVNDVHTAVISGKTYVAVATDGGVSLINETDGTVVNFYDPVLTAGVNRVFMLPNGDFYFSSHSGTPGGIMHNLIAFYQTDARWSTGTATSYSTNSFRYRTWPNDGRMVDGKTVLNGSVNNIYATQGTSTIDGSSNTIYVGTSPYGSNPDLYLETGGVTVIQEKKADETNGSFKYYNKDYSSEEMIGDIRGMWPLNGSGSIANATDIAAASVNATNMTSYNANGTGMTYATGVRGTGITFDGTDDYLKQKVYLSATQTSRVDTAGSAAIEITGLSTYATASQPYAYIVVSTNCDTVGWGYLGAVISGDNLKVFNTKTGTTQNWVTVPSGGTCNAFEVRKTDFQLTTGFSVGLWVKPNTTPQYIGLMSKGRITGDTNGWSLEYNASNKIVIVGNSGCTTSGSITTSTSAWTHIVAVANSSTNVSLYANGVLQDTSNFACGSGIIDTFSPQVIGKTNASPLAGTIDEPFVTAEALTADQIKNMYTVGRKALQNAGTSALNGSSNQVNAVAVSGLALRQAQGGSNYGTASNAFIGTEGGGVSVIDLTSDTLMRAYTTTTNPAINHANVNALTTTTDGNFIAALDSGMSRVNGVSGNANLSTTKYTDVVGVFDKSDGYYKLYENNSLVGKTYVGTSHSPVTNTSKLAVGGMLPSAWTIDADNPLPTINFYGAIDNVNIYDYAVNPRELNISSGNGVSDSVVYLPFEEGEGIITSNRNWQKSGTTTNLVTNPSLETGTTGWGASADATLTNPTSTVFGTKSLGIQRTGSGDSYALINLTNPTGAALHDRTFSFQFRARLQSGSGSTYTTPYVQETTGWTYIAPITVSGLTTEWKYFSASGTFGSGVTSTAFRIIIRPTASVGGTIVEYDGFQVEEKNTTTPYCDGSLKGNGTHTWTGTAHASTSTCEYGSDGELMNGVTWQNDGVKGKSLRFGNTSDDYVTVSDAPSISFTGDFSLSTWIKPTSTSTNQWIFRKIDGGDCSATSSGWGLSYRSNNTLMLLNGTAGCGGTSSTIGVQANKWNYITVVYSGTTATFYLDGVLKSTVTGISVPVDSISSLRIGSKASDTEDFIGAMDEIKMFPYALTPSEIKIEYNLGSVLKLGGDTLGQANLIGKANYDGLVGYWKMDEASWSGTAGEVIDSTGNGNNGVRSGDATTTSTAKYNRAGTFDGTGDRVDITDTTILKPATQITVSGWIKTSSLATNQDVLNKGDGTNPGAGYRALLYTSGSMAFWVYDGSQTLALAQTGASTVSVGQWYQFTGTYDGKNVRIYLNGELKNTSNEISGFTQKAANLYIGGPTSFSGQIDDIRIYNRALSDTEIRNLYNLGTAPVADWRLDENNGITAKDSSENSNNGTLTNGPTWVPGVKGSALSFDGSDDYVITTDNIAFPQGNVDFAVTAWVNLSNKSAVRGIATKGNGSSGYGNYEWDLRYTTATDRFRFTVQNGSDQVQDVDANNLGSPSLSTWYYIHAWHNSINDTINIQVNGGVPDSAQYSFGGWDSTHSVMIGRSTGYFAGTMDNVRIFNYILTPYQIAQEFNAGKAIAQWSFDEGNGQSVHNTGGINAVEVNPHSTTIDGSLGGSLTNTNNDPDWVTDETSCKKGKCLDFEYDNSQYLQLADNVLTVGEDLPWSYSTWINAEDFKSGAVYPAFYGNELSAGKYQRLQFYLGTYIAIEDKNNSGAGSAYKWTHGMSTGQWNLVTVVCNGTDSSNVELFINGISKGKITMATTEFEIRQIGARGTGTMGFDGKMDDVKVFNYALSMDDILREFNQGAAIRY